MVTVAGLIEDAALQLFGCFLNIDIASGPDGIVGCVHISRIEGDDLAMMVKRNSVPSKATGTA